jgi:hypothetical protein
MAPTIKIMLLDGNEFIVTFDGGTGLYKLTLANWPPCLIINLYGH